MNEEYHWTKWECVTFTFWMLAFAGLMVIAFKAVGW